MTMKKMVKIKPKKYQIKMLFESCRQDKQNKHSYLFKEPVKTLIAYDGPGAEKALEEIEKFLGRGYWIAGYLSYELGYSFEKDSFPALFAKKYKFPLLELYAFKKPAILKSSKYRLNRQGNSFKVSNLKFNVPFQQYKDNLEKIKKYIINGDVYQINYTGKLNFAFSGDSFAFYRSLTEKQAVPYSAFLILKYKTVLSLSPELFFSVKKGLIESKPMKGTMERGRNFLEDAAKMKELSRSSKNRAENIMITDLIRNDLGRICRTGSISTSKIYEVIKYNTLLQMISTVRGRLKNKISWLEIFKNIFPGGSITGTPKIRAMQIIRELEKENRKLYCGALGFISPNRNAVFSIPIRTILLKGKTGELGIGSGIVFDSKVKEEYEEALLKARFLTEKTEEFRIIETMLWDKKYFLLNGHLRRLERSAKYFDFRLDVNTICKKLRSLEKRFQKNKKYKLRLLLSKNGSIELSKSEYFLKNSAKWQAVLSVKRVNSKDRFLFHKTTRRILYEEERRKIDGKGIFDVIFLNEREEVTEGAITNIFIIKNGKYHTPAAASGLLPGVFREYLLKEKKATECVIKLKDLKEADRILLVNSVCGIVEVDIKYKM